MNVFSKLQKIIANQFSMAEKAKAISQMQMNPAANSSDNNAVYNDGGQFSPGNPITPNHQGYDPWQYEYRVGDNINYTPRSESGNLLPFNVLRSVAENHDITALCIKMMIDQVTGDEWDIVSADKNDRNHYEDDIQTVKQFFARPDKVHLFNDWLKPILFDCLSIDAATIFKRRTRGGKLYSLEYVDGSTIKPLIDMYGRVPQPPYAAYQQIVYGYPYNSGQGEKTKGLGFTLDEISYRPRYPKSYTRYGTSPIENILMKINIAFRRDSMSFNFYTEGTTPDGGIYSFDKEDMTPDEIKQFAVLYNDIMAGRLKERFKMRFLPKGKYTPTKEHKFDVQFDEWIARLVSIAFGVNPQAFVMMMNRSTSQMQDEQQTELGLDPLETYLAEWFTDIIQNDLGFPHLAWSYVGEKREDAAMSIKRDVDFVQSGILTVDEVRSNRGMPPVTGLPNGTPPFVKVGNDIIFLTEEYIQAKTAAQLEALKAGNVQGGNQSDMENKLRQANQNDPQDTNTSDGEEDIKPDKKKAHKAAQDELRAFQRFAVTRLKKKSNSGRKFEPKVISNEICESIYSRLEKAESVDDVHDIFADAEYEVAVEDALNDSEADITDVFDDFRDYVLSQVENVTEEDLNTAGDAKKYLLLLILLGDYDFNKKMMPVIDESLKTYADIAMKQVAAEIKSMGGKITKAQQKDITDKLVKERSEFLHDELIRVTEERLGKTFMDSKTADDIRSGLKSSSALSADRAKLIATTEQANMQNNVVVATAKESDVVAAVYVTDGVQYDAECANANEQVWSIKHAEENPLEHPNCVRRFHPVDQAFVDSHGGIDEE